MPGDETTRSGGGAWARLALIPPAVLLLFLGVWLIPSLTSMGGLGAALLGVAWVVALVATLRQLSVPMSEADRATIEGELFVRPEDRQDWLARFVTLLTLSTIIAALGLLAHSTAVVIGAMVVAPLMAPIMSLAGALTMTRPVRTAGAAIVVEAGAMVDLGQQAWLGVAASLGHTAPISALRNPFSLLSRLDDLAQDIENIQLSENVWKAIDRAVTNLGASHDLSEKLSRVACEFCGTANPQGEGSCIACGAPLGDVHPTTCPKCGFVITSRESRCPNCQQPL